MKAINKILEYNLYFIFLLVPIVFSSALYLSYISTKQLIFEALIISGICFLCIYTFLKTERIRITNIDLSVLAYLIVVIVNSFLFSCIYEATTFSLLIALYFFIVFFHQFNSVNDIQKSENIIVFIVISGTLVSSLALYDIFLIYSHPLNKIIFFKKGIMSTFGNPNSAAGYLTACIPFSILLVKYMKTRLSRILMSLLLVITLLGVIVSQSRGAWIGILAALIIFKRDWIKIFYYKLRTNKFLVISASTILILTVVLFLHWIIQLNPKSVGGRFYIWTITSKIIYHNPIFGIGYNNYGNEFLEYQQKYFEGTGNEYYLYYADDIKTSFNEFLHTFAETGIIGIVVFLSMIYYFFRNGFLITKVFWGKNALLIRACIYSNIIILFHSFFNSNLHILPIQILFFFNLSLVSYYSIHLSNGIKFKQFLFSCNINKKLKPVIIILLIFACLYLEYNIYNKAVAYYYWQKGIGKVFNEDWNEAIVNYLKAEKYLEDNRELQFYLGTSHLHNNHPDKAIYYLKESLKGFKDKNTYVLMGFAYMQLKKYARTEAYFHEFKVKFPNLLLPDLLLAKLYLEINDYHKASEYLQSVINKKPKFDNDYAKDIKSIAKDMLKDISKSNPKCL